MTTITISRQQPPRLGNGVYYKDLVYKDESAFAIDLTNWIGTFVSRSRAMNLVVNAVGFEEILKHIKHAQPSMKLPSAGTSNTWRVHVEFFWSRTPDLKWWVSGIGLHIKDSVNRIAQANKSAERERLQETYEMKNALAAPSARKLWFEVEKYSDDFDGDLSKGRRVVQVYIDKVYEIAKEVAKMPTNPIGPDPDDPWSILAATFSAGVGSTITALEQLGAVARTGFQVAGKAVEGGEKIYSRMMDGDGVKGVVDMIELGLSLSEFAGPFAPMAGVIIGSFIEIGIANQAGPVTRVRSHMYVCFVGGLVNGLVKSTSIKTTRPADELMFKFGEKLISKLPADQRYNLQIALLEYAFRHPMGEWNLNAMYPDSLPPFPEAYLRYWSPGLLERSLLVQLCKPKYLYK